MINEERVVPVKRTDLLSLYGVMLSLVLTGTALKKLEAADADGGFSLSEDGTYLASEPVKDLDIASTVTDATVYFIPAYDYKGFMIDGVVVPDATVTGEGVTFYKATLASGAVTFEKIGF